MKKACEHCGGTGQLSYFKGESRFLLTWFECPECCGTGCQVESNAADDTAGRRDSDSRSDVQQGRDREAE
jgi:DnaJ-class molecular chaperone